MPAQSNQSLADGVSLLGLLCSRSDGIGSREAARLMGWEATRANRMLGTLREMGLAAQDADRRYRPGPGIHLLAAHCLRGSGLLAAALPVLRDLRQPGIGLALGVLWRGEVSYLLHAAAGRPVEEGLRGHALFPADQSSIGLVLEAAGPDRGARNPPAALAEARRLGYAVHRDGGGARGSVAVAVAAAAPGLPPVAGLAAMADLEAHPPAALAALLRPAAAAVAAALG